MDALKTFKEKANDQEEKVVIYTHRKYIPEEDQDPISPKGLITPGPQIQTPGSTNNVVNNSPNVISTSSQPENTKKKEITYKGSWFKKTNTTHKQSDNQKKAEKKQKKEAKKRLQAEKQNRKLEKENKAKLSQSSQANPHYKSPTDFVGMEPIEPIEIAVDDESTTDTKEEEAVPKTVGANDKGKDDESGDIAESEEDGD